MRLLKKKLVFIILSSILLIISLGVPFPNDWLKYGLYFVSYALVGMEIVLKACRNLFRGKIFDENFLMTVATIGALLIGEFSEAIAVMLFYQIGELFQSYAVDKSRKSIASLMNIRPDFANVKRENGVIKVSPEEVHIGETIVVKPGEKIPLDGVILEGHSMLDTSALTGESIPQEVNVGDNALSGSINQSGVILIQVTKEFEESTVSKILDLVENASSKKSKSENFITKFAKYYTPVVVGIAVLLALIPPVLFSNTTLTDWIYRALTFLVVSCPCALVISIPLSFFGGLGGASKMGILVKGSNYLEALAKLETVVFDKTGTLTEGVFEVQKIEAIGMKEEELLKYATYAESFSNHPISLSLKKAYSEKIEEDKVSNVRELAGLGVMANVDGKEVIVGNKKAMEENQIEYTKCLEIGTILYVAIDGKFVGNIVIADRIKKDAKEAIMKLKRQNIKNIVMLTGDKAEVGEKVAKELEIDQVYAELLPDGKVEKVEGLLQKKSSSKKLAFVGDGINDAPVLALADVGVAMGSLGSDAAIEAADVVIMTDEPAKITNAVQIAKKTLRIVKENIVFALLVKVIVLVLSACGLTTMWWAVFADVGVSILAILNAFRLLMIKK